MKRIKKILVKWQCFLLFAILPFLFSTSLLDAASYATRTLPSSYLPGSSITVTVTIVPDSEFPPSGFILTETSPWLVSNSTPPYDKPIYPTPTFTPKWLDSSGSITTPKTITYTVNVPIDASGTYSFSGIFETLQTGQIPVLGDTILSPASTVEAPSFSPLPGTFDSGVEVILSSETPNARIYYTLDNSEPSESSSRYTVPIEITSTTTIKAKAYKEGMNPSPISSATYTISEPVNGTISGTISYSGIKTGTFSIEAYTNPGFTGVPVKRVTSGSPGEYTLSDLPPQTYYIFAYLDTNNNAVYDADIDPAGRYSAITTITPVTLSSGENKTGISFALYDPLEFVTDLSNVEVGEGSTALLQVKLNRQPATDLTATLAIAGGGDSDITISSPASKMLSFTTSNWNSWQTVTLSAQEDDDVVNGTATLQIRATGVIGKDIPVTEQDNDTLAIVTDATNLTVPEEGTATLKVKLSHQPSGNIEVTLAIDESGDPDITISSPASKRLSFTTSNWDSWQTVTLAAAKDSDVVNGTATLRLTSAGIASKTVALTEQDNDTLAIVTDAANLTVPEEGTATLKVKLSHQPSGNIEVTLAIDAGGDPDITISSPASKRLSFTTSNWNSWQTVTLAAAKDSDVVNGTATLRLTSAGIASKTVALTEQDNDTLAILTTVTELQVPEGGTGEFGVRLSHKPASSVTLTVARISGDTDISVTGGATLLFTSDNWNVWQRVTLSAREDDDTLNGTCRIQITGTGLAPKEILATEIDNDILAIVTDLSEITLSEGGSNSLRVRLSHQPSVAVAVMLSITNLVNADIEISSPVEKTLTFTSANWASWQTVLLSAKEDGNFINGTARLLLEAEGLEEKNVEIFETDTTHNPPRKPVPVTPTNELLTDSLDPLLQASSFQSNEAGMLHSASEWEITPLPEPLALLNLMPSFFIRVNRATGVNLTRVQVPWGVLNPESSRLYSWRVRYRDNSALEETAWSEWSDDALFQIPAIDPVAEAQRLSSSQLESLKEEVKNSLLQYGVAEIVGNNSIGIASSVGEVVMVKSIDPDTLSTQGKPLSLLFGLFSIRIEGIEPGESPIVSFYFPGDFSQYGWYKYSDIEGWSLYPSARTYNKTTGYTKIDISLTDGGRGDQDGVVNGVIVDPSGPGAIPSGDGGGGGGGGCFIATAAFGSYQEPHVRVLRSFRDRFLLTNRLGRLFVQGYYTHSPGYAAIIESHPHIRALVRLLLLPLYGLAWFLLHKGIILLFLLFLSSFAIRRFCEKR
jgi:predicted RNA methylase